MFEDAEPLRERAIGFLRLAERLYNEESYDLAAFSLEQHCQLFLKYKLLVKTGSYPRTHSLTRLVRELVELNAEISHLLNDSKLVVLLAKLEDAYVGARYLPRRYLKAEVEELLKYVKEVFEPVVSKL